MKRKLVARVTALNAGPRGELDTTRLMAWVVEGCIEARAHVSWIDLAGLNIRPCRGCLSCLRVGVCPQDDHVHAVEKRLLDADGIIVGSPVFAGGARPELETLTDRLTFQADYVMAFDEKHVLGVAAGASRPARTAKEAARTFGRRFAVLAAKTTAAPGERIPVDMAHRPRLAARARKLGRRFVARIRRPWRPRPSSLWHAWRGFLRRMSVRLALAEDPHLYMAVIAAWKEKGWLR